MKRYHTLILLLLAALGLVVGVTVIYMHDHPKQVEVNE